MFCIKLLLGLWKYLNVPIFRVLLGFCSYVKKPHINDAFLIRCLSNALGNVKIRIIWRRKTSTSGWHFDIRVEALCYLQHDTYRRAEFWHFRFFYLPIQQTGGSSSLIIRRPFTHMFFHFDDRGVWKREREGQRERTGR